MISSQQSDAPAAGSTRLFQSAERLRPTRQPTSKPQANVPANAAPKAISENEGS